MEDALFLNDERYRTLIQTAMDGFWLVDLQGNLLDVNMAYCQMSGYSEQELLTMNITDLESSETAEETSAHIQIVISKGKDRFTSLHRRKDGDLFYVEVSTQYHPDDGGQFVCFLHDITEHKRLEEQLSQEQAFLRSVIDSADDLIYFKDRNSTYVGCNKASEKFTGITEREQVGKTDFDFFDPEMAEKVVKDDQKVLENRTPVRTEEWIPSPVFGKVFLDTVKAPIYGQEGEPLGLVGISRDITERKKLTAKLQNKTEEQERFIYTISHDLKTPLTAITGFCEVGEEALSSGNIEQCKNSFEIISSSANRMEQLINELLHFSRVGIQQNPRERVCLEALIKDAIERVLGVIEKYKTIIEVESGLPDALVDKQRFLQVIENLVANASRYSRSANGGSHVKIGVIRNAEELTCYVKDNGIGIETQYLEKVFGLFEKLDTNSDTTGVGLAIVKRVIENHGGRIWAESDGLGHGTTFFFTLPEA